MILKRSGEMKIDVTHSVWPWIAERAGFLLTRFEVGRDGWTACERLKGKSAKCSRLGVRRKESCGREDEQEALWEIDVHVGGRRVFGHQGNHRRSHCWRSKRRVAHENSQKKTTKERCERSNLQMIVTFPLRKNEDDEKMDGERLEGEVVLMDKDFWDKLEMEEHVSVPKRAYISREDIETFGFTARCLGCLSIPKGTAGQARKVVEERLKER